MFFNASQLSTANQAFIQAEKWAGRFFGIDSEQFSAYRYDVKTLPYLAAHEVNDGAFAHLCRYRFEKHRPERPEDFHFYRVCLQDDRILDAVERAISFIKLDPLMLYIATHELVHVIRFDRGEIDFDAPQPEKEREEERVHDITKYILKPLPNPDLKLVIDCFSNQYQIGDMMSH